MIGLSAIGLSVVMFVKTNANISNQILKAIVEIANTILMFAEKLSMD